MITDTGSLPCQFSVYLDFLSAGVTTQYFNLSEIYQHLILKDNAVCDRTTDKSDIQKLVHTETSFDAIKINFGHIFTVC